MKIAIVKPDYKIYGGFEVVVDRLIEGLSNSRVSIDLIKVDMTNNILSNRGITIPEDLYYKNSEYFKYLLSFEKFKDLKLNDYDCIISTQPPSYGLTHPKNLLLFYHHMKIYYDLYDITSEVGMFDKRLHSIAADYVREVDNIYLNNDKFYAAGSEHIMKRLKHFNGITKNLYKFSAGINDDFYQYNGSITFSNPICVGRHEFPKRTELFIQAMKYLDTNGIIVGVGGRTKALEDLDIYLTYKYKIENSEVESDFLWKNLFFNISQYNIDSMKQEILKKKVHSNVVFAGRVDNKKLVDYYAKSLCVVCPAYEEDYGLTAIEAMAFGKPVIACSDGGGYTELIRNGETGFIVEPDGKAIAEAIRTLVNYPEKLKIMSRNAYEESRKYSWTNAIKMFDNILQCVMEA